MVCLFLTKHLKHAALNQVWGHCEIAFSGGLVRFRPRCLAQLEAKPNLKKHRKYKKPWPAWLSAFSVLQDSLAWKQTQQFDYQFTLNFMVFSKQGYKKKVFFSTDIWKAKQLTEKTPRNIWNSKFSKERGQGICTNPLYQFKEKKEYDLMNFECLNFQRIWFNLRSLSHHFYLLNTTEKTSEPWQN